MRAWLAMFVAIVAATLAGDQARAETLVFERGCQGGERIRVGAVGDLLFHDALQRRALLPGQDFRRLWGPVQPLLSSVDILYGNLEGPAAHGVGPGGGATRDPGRTFDGHVYGKVPGSLVFNFHPSVIEDLKASRFSVLSTANNHAADRGPLGIDRTIEQLDAAGIAYTGTRRRGDESRSWSVVTRAKGIGVGWLACTYSTNGMPDRAGQVLNCYSQRATVMDELRRLRARADVDAVVLTPHWGSEYVHEPLASDRAYAREALEAGADAVLGAHPHVLQPWERHRTRDGREGLVVFSMGNFISNQQRPAQRSGVIVLFDLVKTGGDKASIAGAGFLPTWVEFTAGGHRVAEMKGDPRQKGSPIEQTLRLLPRGNRVSLAAPERLAHTCAPDLIAAAAATRPSAKAKAGTAVQRRWAKLPLLAPLDTPGRRHAANDIASRSRRWVKLPLLSPLHSEQNPGVTAELVPPPPSPPPGVALTGLLERSPTVAASSLVTIAAALSHLQHLQDHSVRAPGVQGAGTVHVSNVPASHWPFVAPPSLPARLPETATDSTSTVATVPLAEPGSSRMSRAAGYVIGSHVTPMPGRSRGIAELPRPSFQSPLPAAEVRAVGLSLADALAAAGKAQRRATEVSNMRRLAALEQSRHANPPLALDWHRRAVPESRGRLARALVGEAPNASAPPVAVAKVSEGDRSPTASGLGLPDRPSLGIGGVRPLVSFDVALRRRPRPSPDPQEPEPKRLVLSRPSGGIGTGRSSIVPLPL